ncbi:hypothetical protein GCM10022287_00750 [Gryllotalpicola koreensis]|uniref:Uncharacterized protein n=1 Tax=Gryllotalpicola koreensis TaxID=993086 RepID=A0ABP7ZQ54_9MICO
MTRAVGPRGHSPLGAWRAATHRVAAPSASRTLETVGPLEAALAAVIALRPAGGTVVTVETTGGAVIAVKATLRAVVPVETTRRTVIAIETSSRALVIAVATRGAVIAVEAAGRARITVAALGVGALETALAAVLLTLSLEPFLALEPLGAGVLATVSRVATRDARLGRPAALLRRCLVG